MESGHDNQEIMLEEMQELVLMDNASRIIPLPEWMIKKTV